MKNHEKIKKNSDYLLERLCCFSGVDILCFCMDKYFHYQEYVNFNPFKENVEFRDSLMKAADEQNVPLIFLDSHDIVFACIRQDVGMKSDAYVMVGPIALKDKSRVELHYYYRDYGMKKGTERPLPALHFTKIIELVALVAGILTETHYTYDQLIKGNHFDSYLEQILEEEQKRFAIDQDCFAHHTYEEERKLLNAVREGRTEEAVKLSMVIDSSVGHMSKKVELQWSKTATVAIALCTRAAIEGGLSPAEAYQVSDFYEQKCDECKNAGQLVDCRNRAVYDLAQRVRKRREISAKSNYVERCCDYIQKHYREKIHPGDLADSLELNPSYLSRIFSKEMGMSMQEYIVKERVRRAANMLMYSDLEIAKIGDYVNFPSQSYFGKMFKKYMHMTPGKYRNLYKPKEFTDNNK